MPPPPESAPARPRRRADAERSVERILEAAVEALASDPDVSMGEIARRAGVVRATIYVHFPDREALIRAVTERAISEVAGVIEQAEPGRGDPGDALERVVSATWRALGRFHALVALNTLVPQDELRALHRPVLDQLKPLIRRGQRDGAFRRDVPAEWHLSMLLALVHAASAEHTAGRLGEAKLERAIVETVVGAVSA